MSTLSFWLATPTACGLVETDASGTVTGGCPYFRKAYRGRPLNEVVAGLRRQGRTVRWQRLAADTGVVVVVFGGRDYRDREAVFAALDTLRATYGIAKVVEGGATGADRLARDWAKARGIPYRTVDAEWDNTDRPGAVVRRRRDGTLYDAAAGGLRNQRVLDEEHPDIGVEFPGGTGTADMHRRCVAAGLEPWRPAHGPPPLLAAAA